MAWVVRTPGPGESWHTPEDAEIADIMADAEAALRARLPPVATLSVLPDSAREVRQRPGTDGRCCVGRIAVDLADGRTQTWRVWCNIRTGARRLFRNPEREALPASRSVTSPAPANDADPPYRS